MALGPLETAVMQRDRVFPGVRLASLSCEVLIWYRSHSQPYPKCLEVLITVREMAKATFSLTENALWNSVLLRVPRNPAEDGASSPGQGSALRS